MNLCIFNSMKTLLVILLFLGSVKGFAESEDANSASAAANGSSVTANGSSATANGASVTAKGWVASIQRSSQKKIRDLSFSETSYPVLLVKSKARNRPFVQIFPELHREGWKLFLNDARLELVAETFIAPNTASTAMPSTARTSVPNAAPTAVSNAPSIRYKANLYLNGPSNVLNFVAKGPAGQIESESMTLNAPEVAEFVDQKKLDGMKLSSGLGYFTYRQTKLNTFTSVTGVFSGNYYTTPKPNHFSYAAELMMTGVTLVSNQGSYGPQVIQFDLEALYNWPESMNSMWTLQLSGSFRYITVVNNGAPFGFQDLIAPEVGLIGKYPIQDNSDYFVSVRYSPYSTLIDPSQKRLALAVGKTWVSTSHRQLDLSLRYEDVAYMPAQNQTVNYSLSTFIFGFSF